MKQIILIGAGGFGREVAAMIRHTNSVKPSWDLLGFVDDDSLMRDQRVSGHPVLGPIQAIRSYPGAWCACCVAEPDTRRQLVGLATAMGARWATLVHHTAVVVDTAELGEGCILLPFSAVTTEAHLGRHVHVNYHSAIGHDGWLDDYVTLSSYVDITGKARLGSGVFVGSGASILPGRTVGEHAVIGAGAVVNRDIPPWAVAVGVPARVIREREVAGSSAGTGAESAAAATGREGEDQHGLA
jgi:sugar O-acyltransferase (sialic acid O-acetyltransferase NeuD family)